MSYTTKTLADLKQDLADRHDNGVLPTSTTVINYWIRLLNKSKDYCVSRLHLTKQLTFTTSSGVYTLPTDFTVLDSVVDSENKQWGIISPTESVGIMGYYYWVTGNPVDGFIFNIPFTNSETDKTFTISYTYKADDMVIDADKCIIQDYEAVSSRAYGYLRASETDPLDDVDKSFAECDRRLNDLIYNRNLNNGGNDITFYVNG